MCSCVLSSDRKYTIDKHRSSKKHFVGQTSTAVISQCFFTDLAKYLTEKVVKAFLFVGIPLYKLRNKEIKELFDYICSTYF